MLPPATKTLNNQPFVLVSEGPLKSFELYHTFAKPWKMRENTNVTRNWEAMLRHIASYSRLRQKWQKTPPQPRSTLRKYNMKHECVLIVLRFKRWCLESHKLKNTDVFHQLSWKTSNAPLMLRFVGAKWCQEMQQQWYSLSPWSGRIMGGSYSRNGVWWPMVCSLAIGQKYSRDAMRNHLWQQYLVTFILCFHREKRRCACVLSHG